MYLPVLLNRRKAGYGVGSSSEDCWRGDEDEGSGMMRLGALCDEGPLRLWWLPLMLSRLRERFEDEVGTARGADAAMMAVGSEAKDELL